MCRRVGSAWILWLLGAAALAGCGDDAADDGGARHAHAGEGSGAGGAGGAGRGAAASGVGGEGLPEPAIDEGLPEPAIDEGLPEPAIECGASTCAAMPAGFGSACCAERATSTCGISRMGGQCSAVAEDALGCPVLDLGGLLKLPSCCTSRGMCGVEVLTVGGQDCVDLASAAERARMAGATAVFPGPRACDADAGVDTDAGL